MGLGNGMLLRLKRTGLCCEEMHGSVHQSQISSLQVNRGSTIDYLLTAGTDKILAVHKMDLTGKEININQLTLERV